MYTVVFDFIDLKSKLLIGKFVLIYIFINNKKYNNYSNLNIYINVLDYILVTIYLLLRRTIKQIFSSRNV